jgi:hypothetical protein
MAPKFPLIDPSLHGGADDGGILGAVASATLAGKGKKRRPWGRVLPLQPSPAKVWCYNSNTLHLLNRDTITYLSDRPSIRSLVCRIKGKGYSVE